MENMLLWLQLIVGGALIVLSGAKLTRYADVFSEKLGLGQAFVGMVFLGWVTSLPEMVMSITGVSLGTEGSANLTVGNLMGSIYFNVFVLAFMELVLRRRAVMEKVNPHTILPAAFAMIMSMLAVMGLMVAEGTSPLAAFLTNPLRINIGIFSFLILALYCYSTWLLYRQEKKITNNAVEEKKEYESWSLGVTAVKAVVGMLIIVACGIWVAAVADKIADANPALSKGFMGTVFLAIISSLPEFTTTIAAGRMGRFDMAVGNVFGSNIFNVMILGVSDVVYTQTSIFQAQGLESHKHEMMGMFGILLSLVFVAGLVYRSKRSVAGVSWTAIVITIIYAAGLVGYYFI